MSTRVTATGTGVLLGAFDNVEKTVDAKGCLVLDLPDEVLVWLERFQGD